MKKSAKHPVGRPTKYRKEYCDELLKFFNIDPYFETPITYTDKKGNVTEKVNFIAADLPTLAGFAKKIGISRDTLNEWTREHPEFSDAIKKSKECQESILTTNALRGDYNPAFSIFFAKNNMGWKDRTDLTTNDKDLPTPLLNGIHNNLSTQETTESKEKN